jgi:hypothetical protein
MKSKQQESLDEFIGPGSQVHNSMISPERDQIFSDLLPNTVVSKFDNFQIQSKQNNISSQFDNRNGGTDNNSNLTRNMTIFTPTDFNAHKSLALGVLQIEQKKLQSVKSNPKLENNTTKINTTNNIFEQQAEFNPHESLQQLDVVQNQQNRMNTINEESIQNNTRSLDVRLHQIQQNTHVSNEIHLSSEQSEEQKINSPTVKGKIISDFDSKQSTQTIYYSMDKQGDLELLGQESVQNNNDVIKQE